MTQKARLFVFLAEVRDGRSRERERVYGNGGGKARERRRQGGFVAGDPTWAQTVKRDMAFEFRYARVCVRCVCVCEHIHICI